MNIYEQLGIKTIINAHDSETIWGGSRMPQEVIQAMADSSNYFVRIQELEKRLSEEIAKLTRNEACFITSGAAAGMVLSVAACMTGDDSDKIDQMPNLDGMKDEVIIHRSQRNGFDQAVRQTGVKLVEIGDKSGATLSQLEAAVTEQTACIVYYAGAFEKNALPIEEVTAFGNERSIPVIIDAAAQLPPVENLWHYTEMGADLVLFSGGKTLRGPQATGFILGKKDLIKACQLNGSPNDSIGRPMKVAKEEMVGLYTAIKRYLELDHEQIRNEQEESVQRIIAAIDGLREDVDAKRLYPGPHGQHYPRVEITFRDGDLAQTLSEQLEDGTPSIFTRYRPARKSITINPLHLTTEEVTLVIQQLTKYLTS